MRIVVPATTANIGAGYDAVGMAFKLYNIYDIELCEKGIGDAAPDDDLTLWAMRKTFEKAKAHFESAKIAIKADIPITRGLGSSAACIVAGVIAANSLGTLGMNEQHILDMVCSLEGHPDNAAPALLGGLVAAIINDGEVFYERRAARSDIATFAVIPGYPLSTRLARQLLPKTYPAKDAIFNIGRATLMFAALSEGGADRTLPAALNDKMHEQYRSPLMPGYAEVSAAAKECGAFGVVLSGAGPTMLAMTSLAAADGFEPRLRRILPPMARDWSILQLSPDNRGAYIVI